MAARYWDYLETVASRLMGSQLTSEIVHSGSVPSAARQWVEATDGLIDNAGISDKHQWGKIQSAVTGTYKLLGKVFEALAQQGRLRKLPPILR